MLRFNYISMDYLEKAARVLEIEIFELQRLRQRLGKSFGDAIELLKATLDARGKIVVLGVGKSGHIGSKIAATLTSTGSPAVVLDSLNALHGDLGMVADGDAVVALSASGETEELLRILPTIAQFAHAGPSGDAAARGAGAGRVGYSDSRRAEIDDGSARWRRRDRRYRWEIARYFYPWRFRPAFSKRSESRRAFGGRSDDIESGEGT